MFGTQTSNDLRVRFGLGLLLAAMAVLSNACSDGSGGATPSNTATRTTTPTPPATVTPTVGFAFLQPTDQQLSLAGSVAVTLELPRDADGGSLSATLDGASVTSAVTVSNGEAHGTLANVGEGRHTLQAEVGSGTGTRHAQVSFETVALNDPDNCEVLNNAECMLPYPSSRFLEPADTPNGWRLNFPASGMPVQSHKALSPDPYKVLDGFSPTVQILMHFPGGVDPAASQASRLLPETRTYDLRSLDADSPTVLLDVNTDTRILHFIENDAQPADDPTRQALFLRPGRSLTPGHRYIVAVRRLLHADGTLIAPEPAFAVLRDNRPTDIQAITSRRAQFEDVFARLTAAGVARNDLQLAFDFIVQSDQGLTGQILSMRDQSFAWLAAQAAAGQQTFTVDNVVENDCGAADVSTWRIVEGSYQVPLFLSLDPVTQPMKPGMLTVDPSGAPVQNGFTHPPFTIAIPCTALANGGTAKRPVVLGHGLFGTGRDMVTSLASRTDLSGLDLITGATDWSGLAAPDITPFVTSFVVSQVVLRLGNFAALPDRLRQGQLNTLVLARMMKTGAFNADSAFRTPSGVAVLAGPQQEEFYFGVSLGGIMGLMFSALSPDIVNADLDVPAINFSILLQRATPFTQFEGALRLTGITDPIQTALLIDIINELWVRGEPAGYATHVTGDPLPGTNAKHILMTMAWLDQTVTNVGTEIAARTLGLPNLTGSLRTNLAEIPDRPGPLPSAFVIYDTGSFDLHNPAHAPFIPPLANLTATPSCCDPHGRRGFIPASIDQMLAFLQPGGQVTNTCDGTCDAGEPREIPFGDERPCDPLACPTPGS